MSECPRSRAGRLSISDDSRPEFSDHHKRLIFRHMALAQIGNGPLSASRRRHLLRYAQRLGIRHDHARFLIAQAQHSLDAMDPPDLAGQRRPAWSTLLSQSLDDWLRFALLAVGILAVELLLLGWLTR